MVSQPLASEKIGMDEGDDYKQHSGIIDPMECCTSNHPSLTDIMYRHLEATTFKLLDVTTRVSMENSERVYDEGSLPMSRWGILCIGPVSHGYVKKWGCRDVMVDFPFRLKDYHNDAHTGFMHWQDQGSPIESNRLVRITTTVMQIVVLWHLVPIS